MAIFSIFQDGKLFFKMEPTTAIWLCRPGSMLNNLACSKPIECQWQWIPEDPTILVCTAPQAETILYHGVSKIDLERELIIEMHNQFCKLKQKKE